MRVVADTALSRFTFDLSFKLPKFVRRKVSGLTPTLKESLVKDVTVRHVPMNIAYEYESLDMVERGRMMGGFYGDGVPLMLILSPRWASVRISAQSPMVREVPPPPAEESSCFSRVVTAGWVRDFSLRSRRTWRKWRSESEGGLTAYHFDYAREHRE